MDRLITDEVFGFGISVAFDAVHNPDSVLQVPVPLDRVEASHRKVDDDTEDRKAGEDRKDHCYKLQVGHCPVDGNGKRDLHCDDEHTDVDPGEQILEVERLVSVEEGPQLGTGLLKRWSICDLLEILDVEEFDTEVERAHHEEREQLEYREVEHEEGHAELPPDGVLRPPTTEHVPEVQDNSKGSK